MLVNGIMIPITAFLIEKFTTRRLFMTAMGSFGLVIAFATALGPSLSGYLVEQYPWPSGFYVVLPIAIINLNAAYFILKNITKERNPKLDVLSVILSTIGFGGVLYGFSIAGDLG